jgi:DNA-binding helix-hairpin-helix protein with protein kinase domain/Flp pilus assembly protein TadD
MRQVYNSKGQLVTLGAELGRGGEGGVFEVTGDPARVAKIYHETVRDEKVAKLSAMVNLATPELLKLTAWAVDTLHGLPGGKVVGVLMFKLSSHKEIHHLYSPKSRLVQFTKADWRFLIHAAANVARAFHVLHEGGNVIGDVNHGNIVVSNDATVKLIDCDSFQISTADGRKFLCPVGVSTHTPPELQGKPFASTYRTPNHDAFGLAVIIFQLLFMGRHPFSGTYLGVGDMPLEKAIGEFRFAYGASAGARQMRQPPGALSLDAVTKTVSDLFSRAFTRQDNRPTAKEWIDALSDLASNLKSCTEHPAHYYLKTLSSCPWCEIEGQTGVTLFPFPVDFGVAGQQGITLDKLWQQIQSIPSPGAPPALLNKSALQFAPSSVAVQAAKTRRARIILCVCVVVFITLVVAIVPIGVGAARVFLIIIAGWITVAFMRGHGSEIHLQLQSAHESARAKWQELDERWQRETDSRPFDAKRRELEAKKREYEHLPQVRQQKLDRLRAESEARQLQKYLDRFEIEDAEIRGIGFSKKATLQSYGIETAADIDYYRVLAVPGFGPTYTDRLLSWRASLERRFRFDPSKGIDPADIAAVEREIAVARSKIIAELRNSLPHLRQLSEGIRTARSTLKPSLDEATQSLAQAELDWTNVSSAKTSVVPVWATAGVGALIVLMMQFAAHNGGTPSRQTSLTDNANTARSVNTNSSNYNISTTPSPSPSINDPAAEARTLYDQGVVFTRSGRFSEAADAFRRTVTLNQDFAEAHHELGYALFRLRKYDESIAALEQSVRLRPRSADSYHVLGLSYSATARWNEASQALRQATANNPNSPTFYFDFGVALKNAEDYPSAVRAFQKAVRLRPNYAVAHYELGLAYLANGDQEAAEEQCRVLQSLNQRLAEQLCTAVYQ